MILVVGASGRLGGLITAELLARGERIRLLDRGSGSSPTPAGPGVDVVAGDLKDPASLRAACVGVDAVVTTANSSARGGADDVDSVERHGNKALIDAAVGAGVGRFVFTSLLGASVHSPAPFVQAKAEAEEHLRSSEMTWTVLRPNAFMDVWFPAVLGPALAGQPVTLVGEGRRRHSLVAARDVAAYAVSALTSGLADRETLVIGGPAPISWRDIIVRFEQRVGHPVDVRSVTADEGVPHLPASMVQVLAFMESYDSPLDMTALSARHGVAPTPADVVIDSLVSGSGSASARG